MLAEFKYGLVPKESFSQYFDQAKPNRCVPSRLAGEVQNSCVAFFLQTFLPSQKGAILVVLSVDYLLTAFLGRLPNGLLERYGESILSNESI